MDIRSRVPVSYIKIGEPMKVGRDRQVIQLAIGLDTAFGLYEISGYKDILGDKVTYTKNLVDAGYDKIIEKVKVGDEISVFVKSLDPLLLVVDSK